MIRLIPEKSSTDFALLLQTRHPPTRVRPKSISRPAPRLHHPAASPRSRPRQWFDFRIRPRPMWSCNLWSPANLLRPTVTRAAGRDIFLQQFPHRPSSLASAHALPSVSPQILALGRISSGAVSTSPSERATKPSLCGQVRPVRAHSQTPSPPCCLVPLRSGPSTFLVVYARSRMSCLAERDRTTAPARQNWECEVCKFRRNLWPARSGHRASPL